MSGITAPAVLTLETFVESESGQESPGHSLLHAWGVEWG
jgi:hypothetical protein